MFNYIKRLFGFGKQAEEVAAPAAPYKVEQPVARPTPQSAPKAAPAIKTSQPSANKKPRGRKPQGNKPATPVTQVAPVEQPAAVPPKPKKPRTRRPYNKSTKPKA